MTDMCLVLVSMPSMEAAAGLARTLVEEESIACANLVPNVRSIYRWKGSVCDETEVLMIIKTRASVFEPLRSRIAALHPYDVPEIVKVDVAAAHAPYLDWLTASVRTGA